MKRYNDNFIMLPTVDICFKQLMQNPKVRRGFIAALLKIDPESIRETTLLPTILEPDYEGAKQGILDVRVLLWDKTQLDMEMQVNFFEDWTDRVLFYTGKMFVNQIKKGEPYGKLEKCIHVSILDFILFPGDEEYYRVFHFRDDKTGKVYSDKMEIQVLELRKLPQDIQTGEDIITWMKFFSGKNREEFEQMAKTNEYLDEAYSTLLDLSADDLKRLEYETREKALRDYNSQMESAERRGLAKGEERGQKIGEKRGEKIGEKRGEKRGREYGIHVLIEICQEMGFNKEMAMKKIMEKYNLASEEAKEKTEQYWKQNIELK